MKNQNVLRILALVFAIAMMLTVASCDMLDKLLGKPEVTTPEVTTEEPTEVTTPEPTTPAHEHTEEVVPGKAATCTETGLTDGKKCSECGEELVAREEIPVIAHTEEVVAGKAATCTEAGLTDGKKCSVCGEVLVAQEEIAMLDHTYGTNVTVVTPAACTVAGKGTVACECGATKEVEIKALGHTKVAIPAVAPTCVADGLTAGEKCAVCNEVLVAQTVVAKTPTIHSYTRDYINNEQRFNATWGVCTDCGYVEAKHEHIVENGVCKYCEVAPFELEVTSIFDFNKDEKNDTFTMSNMLPEKFRAEGVAHVNAKADSLTTAPHGEYDEIKAGSGNKIPYPHFYVSDGDKANSYLLYNVTVAEAGTYDLAIHIRLKDARYREARIIINGETALDFSYGWSESSSAVLDETTSKLLSNDFLIGSYIYGFQVKLKAGVNEIKISAPGQTAKTQHYRDLFFALASCDSHSYQDDIANNEARFNATWGVCTDCGYVDAKHEHIVENGKCKYCGVAPFEMEVTSIFDFNKDEKNDTFTMANMLPEKFRAEGVVSVNAKADSLTTAPHGEYDEITDSNAATNMPYPHFYVSDGDKANSYLLYNVTVEEAGTYDLAIHYRLKDARYREARITINGETALDFSYGWSESSSAALDDNTKKLLSNDYLIGTYVYGFQVKLKAGVNEIKISAPGQTAKTQHFRNLFFALASCDSHSYQDDIANNEARFNATWGVCTDCGYVDAKHEHIVENGKCKYCGVAPFEMEVTSIFDFNKDEKNDTFTMANMLPEKFRAEGVVSVNAKADSLTTAPHGEYDEITDSNAATNMPYPHFYVSDGDKANSYLLYNVTVAEAGTYDLAIHYRLKDARYREARITINGETALDFSYGWSESSSAALDDTTKKLLSNDYLIGTYVYGFQVKLKAGVNEIKISAPGQTAKTQHFRNLFFALASCDSHSYQDDIANNEQRFNATWGVCTDCGYVEAKHEHIVENGKCKYCGATPNTMEVTSIFDFDKDEKNDTFTMSNMLPEKFRAEGVVNVNAKADSLTTAPHGEYDEITDSNAATNLAYPHFYVSDGDKANSYLLYNVVVDKAGVYDLAIHYRLKDARYREARITINGETALDFSYGWSESSSAALDDNTKKLLSNDYLIGTYVYGFQVKLKAGVNEIKISAPGQTAKTQHFRNLFFSFAHCNECVLVNSKCINCGFNCEHNDLDANYVCKNCKKDFGLTLEEAIAEGLNHKDKGENFATEEAYYVTVTLNGTVNATSGFARVYTTYDGQTFVISGYSLKDGQTYPALGDTIVVRGTIGSVNSNMNSTTYEARMYKVELVANLSANCEHDWAEATCAAPATCKKCNAVKGDRLAHQLNSAYVCTGCGRDFALTPAEANAKGNAVVEKTTTSGAATKFSVDGYYVTVTINNGAPNATGFVRVKGEDDKTFCINNIKLADGQEMPAEGATVTVYGKLGRISNGEVRMYDAVIVDNPTAAQ